jgi:hypothetical protein
MSDSPLTTSDEEGRGPSPTQDDTSSARAAKGTAGGAKRNSITDRFLNAKEEQRKREEERRTSFKSQRSAGAESLGSISGRFEAAKQEQMAKEESRRSSFKSLNTSCKYHPETLN